MILPAGFEFFTVFIFVFGVVYGLLILSDIFGKDQKRVNAIIALAFGLFSASYEPVVIFITNFLPYATAILIFMFFLAFLKLIVFGRSDKKGGKSRDPVVLLVMLIAVIFFFAAAGSSGILDRYLPNLPYFDMSNILWGLGLLIAAAILYVAYDKTVNQTASKPPKKKIE